MAVVTAFRDALPLAITGGAFTAFNNTNAHIGVGNSTTVFSAAHTDLQGGSKFRRVMDATYPTIATNVMTFRTTFATGEANFAIEEWGIFNASSSGLMMCRKVESHGTKTSSQTLQFTAAITVAI